MSFTVHAHAQGQKSGAQLGPDWPWAKTCGRQLCWQTRSGPSFQDYAFKQFWMSNFSLSFSCNLILSLALFPSRPPWSLCAECHAQAESTKSNWKCGQAVPLEHCHNNRGMGKTRWAKDGEREISFPLIGESGLFEKSYSRCKNYFCWQTVASFSGNIWIHSQPMAS